MKDEMCWDLSRLVESEDPEWILRRLEDMVDSSSKLKGEYSGKVGALDARGLLALLERMDSFFLNYEGVTSYCSLRYHANSTDDLAKRYNEASRNASVKVGQNLAFLEIELGQALASNPTMRSERMLFEYSHFLERIGERAPFLLSEQQEQLVMGKDRNGIGAWSQLHGDWLSTRSFKMRIDGREQDLNYGQAIAHFTSPDRELRREAYRTVMEGLGRDEIVFASAMRAVCSDHLAMCEWRKYPTPMTQSLISNDVEEKAVISLMKVVERNAELYRRYLRVKAKLLGLERLGNWDLMAPLPQAAGTTYDWVLSRKVVTRAYASFDPEFGRWAEEMYSKRHIDGEVRNGKSPGAFCHSWLSGRSAYILQSFNNRISDVYTQAHEMGHAVHAYLYGRAQRPANCDIGSAIAECGSIFGELLLTERLLEEARSTAEKQVALATVLDELGVAVFVVGARYWFEEDMYEAIKRGHFLDGETLGDLWTSARSRVFADEVEWLPEMRYDWTRPVHYYMANYRFYNYPYIFAQLFVFSLYRLYKEQGKGFVPQLRGLLAAGSSRSPADLAKDLGFDIATEDFWEKGMRQAEEFLRILEETL